MLTQCTTEVLLKYVKYSHWGTMASFLPGLGSVLQAAESPLKATEERWEEALPAEGSALPKCQHHSAIINRQRWQSQSWSLAQLFPHDKTYGQEMLGNINRLYHFHFLRQGGDMWRGRLVFWGRCVDIGLRWGLRWEERRCISHGYVPFILEEIWRGFRPQRLLNSH